MILPRVRPADVTRDWDECAAVGRLDVAGWCSSGVLVHSRVVLTTAHSGPLGGTAVPRAVILRTADLTDSAGAEIIEGKFVAHESYTGKGAYDLAAMILERESSTRPVDLASSSEIAGATEVTLTGFGADCEARMGLRLRRAVTVPVAFFAGESGAAPPDPFASIRFNQSVEFLCGADDCGPSYGDSGGPAYIVVEGRPKLAGIISRPAARRAPYCKGLTVLTRIDALRSWIQLRIDSLTATAVA